MTGQFINNTRLVIIAKKKKKQIDFTLATYLILSLT